MATDIPSGLEVVDVAGKLVGEEVEEDFHGTLVAGVWCDRQAEPEGVSRLQHHGAVRESANAYFWSLQVRKNPNVAAMMACLPTDMLGDFGVV